MTDNARYSSDLMPYEISGPKMEVPIVLIPGGLSGWVSWKPHAEALSNHHQVIRIQLINMAAAEKNRQPDKGYSLRSESVALEKTLDNLRIRRIHLVGWSHGGEVSLDFALNNPGRIATLTLIEPAAYWVARGNGQYIHDSEEILHFFRNISDPPSEDDLIRFLMWNGLVPPGRDPRSLPQWPLWNTLKIALLSLHTVVEHEDDIQRLRVLREIPVLLVRGRDSVGFNAGIITLLAQAFGERARLLELPDAHASHIVAKDEFLAALERHVLHQKPGP
jgi:pimeloyl-ACP methyl ester carboxylesterase